MHDTYIIKKKTDSVKFSAAMQEFMSQGIDDSYINVLEDINGGYTTTIILHKSIVTCHSP